MAQGNNSSPSANPAEIYEQFYVQAIFRHWTPILLEFARPKPGEHILDLACGTGIVARTAAQIIGDQGRVVGLDVNKAMLEVASRRANSSFIEWQEGNAEKTTFPDQSFDLVLCQAGLMLFGNKVAAASEMRRVLKPDGRAVVLVWKSLDHNPFNKALLESLSRRMGIEIAAITPSYSLGDVPELITLMSKAGFSKISVYPVQYYTFVDDPEQFMELNFRGAAAALPIYASMDDRTRSELIEGVTHDLEPMMPLYLHRGRLIYPQAANIALASV
jgi:ubiquinone/menaquinone biosynthesis C-methylase UbiE